MSGAEKENSLHIVIEYYKNPNQKKELDKIKNKVLELKKSIVYSKSIDSKLFETELNTSRSDYNSRKNLDQELSAISTYRELTNFIMKDKTKKAFIDESEMTNRTNKSVRFNETVEIKNSENSIEEQYKNLTQLISETQGFNYTLDKDLNIFSLDLPLTPRSIDGKSLPNFSALGTEKNILYLNYHAAKILQNLSDQINNDFIKEY